MDPNDDLPRFSDADRRTLRWIAAAVLAVLVGFATARWTLGVVERLDVVTAIAALVATTSSSPPHAAAAVAAGRQFASRP